MAQLAPASETAPVPPQNLEAEESVLGAMMLSPGAVEAVSAALEPADFYRESHAKIYRAAVGLYQRGEPVDAITLVDELEERGELEEVGGRVKVHELAALVPATANAGHYARIVREMATLRGLIRVGGQISRLGWERPGDASELAEEAERLVFDLAEERHRGAGLVAAGDALGAVWDRIEARGKAGGALPGLSTGFAALDELTTGLQPGNLVVVAARPSMGKSALALGLCAHAAMRDGLPVALFTLEMSRDEVIERLLSAEGLVESQRIRRGNLSAEDWQRLGGVAARIQRAPLFIEDSGLVTVGEILSRARRLKSRHPNLALVAVDYLQLMTSGTSAASRVEEVSQISRGLKILARELNVPVVALSQLSRAPEQRHDRRPILSDLRESGSIEQDADLVLFVYRDEYYNPEDTDQAGIAEVIIAKQRNGPTDTAKLGFVKRFAKFSELVPGSLPGST